MWAMSLCTLAKYNHRRSTFVMRFKEVKRMRACIVGVNAIVDVRS
jgi:hypothetical protein